MSFLSSLLAWANAPFTVAIGVALVFAAMQMTGLLGLLAGGGDHDGDHEVDADHDLDADADVDGDADADVDGDADGDADADADHDGDHDGDAEDDHAGFGQQLLSGLGVGKVPLSIIWQTYAVSFGFAGIAANTIYVGRSASLPTMNLVWTLPLAALFGYGTTRLLARSLGRVIADPHQEATSRKQLVGHTGVVISSKINDEFGEIRVHDKTGHVVRIVCRTRDAGVAIPEGREVVIVDYDRDADRLYVAALDEDLDEEAPGRQETRAP